MAESVGRRRDRFALALPRGADAGSGRIDTSLIKTRRVRLEALKPPPEAAIHAGRSGLRSDGPSIRMVIQ